jgi:hypothetical protein
LHVHALSWGATTLMTALTITWRSGATGRVLRVLASGIDAIEGPSPSFVCFRASWPVSCCTCSRQQAAQGGPLRRRNNSIGLLADAAPWEAPLNSAASSTASAALRPLALRCRRYLSRPSLRAGTPTPATPKVLLCSRFFPWDIGLPRANTGNGVMARFGYPVAHEDDAERAE